MTYKPLPPTIYLDIDSGVVVDLRTASNILKLKYQTARYRIVTAGLDVFRLGKRCYVRVSDLKNPRLQVGWA